MKKYHAIKLEPGIYVYRGHIITKDELDPDYADKWLINVEDHFEVFDHRAEAQHHIDRLLATPTEVARSASDRDLECTDLTDYCTPANVLEVQTKMYNAGSLTTRETILAHAQSGLISQLKRQLLRSLAAGHYAE